MFSSLKSMFTALRFTKPNAAFAANATSSHARRIPSRPRRWLRLQSLEPRFNFSAEGAEFTLSRSFDTAGLLGNVSATVNWGDGSAPTAATITGGASTGNIKLKFDYSLDTSGFMNDPARRSALELAGQMATSRLNDTLSAITPSGNNRWSIIATHPATGNNVTFNNPTIAANELLVYVGARNLGSSTLALGGPGGQSAEGTQAWIDTVFGRGETGALGTASNRTDFAPWGGTLTFNPTTNWHFGIDDAGLDSGEMDFVTVATHELIHLLGFGIADSWKNLASGGNFTGTKSKSVYDGTGNVPLSSDGAHWLESITEGGQKTIMGPIITAGKRELPTALDWAAMDDMGWEVASTTASLSASRVYADNGTYPISITIQGSSLGELSLSASASVTNVAPTLTVPSNQTALVGSPLSLTNIGSISDPGYRNLQASTPTAETFTYSINWGDGSAAETGTATIDRQGSASQTTLASFNGSHTYQTAGNYTVTVRATDDDGGTTQQTFSVNVTAPPQISLSLNRATIVEDAGADAATLTITRSGPAPTSDITIQLTSSDTSELTLPSTAILRAGTTSVSVAINAVDDNLLDGSQSVTINASSAASASNSIDISVTDAESLTASFSGDSIREDAAANSFQLTITRSNTDTTSPLTVAVLGNVASQITVPTSIVIPAGQRSVQVAVTPINDDRAELTATLNYQFTAAGYTQATASLQLIDDEKPKFQNPNDVYDVDGSGIVTPLDALRVINAIARRDRGNAQLNPDVDSFGTNFVDVSGDYLLTPLDALRVINEFARRKRGQEATEPLAAAAQGPDDKVAENQVWQPTSEGSLF